MTPLFRRSLLLFAGAALLVSAFVVYNIAPRTVTPDSTIMSTSEPTVTTSFSVITTVPSSTTETSMTRGACPTGSGVTGRIAFDNFDDIYAANIDGTNLKQLTTNPAHDFDPSWSPDGTRIAFRTDRDGEDEIYVMNADGSEQTNLTNNPAEDYSPAWSPDGTRIAFASTRDGAIGNIYVTNVDGSNVTRLTKSVGGEYPTWSPDGEKIAFISDTDFGPNINLKEGWDIFVMNADGSGLTRLTDSPGGDKLPDWSPDGQRIIFQSDRDKTSHFTDIWVMNPDGTGQTRLTYNNGYAPNWSPDGCYIVFSAGTLYVMNADGSNVRALQVKGVMGELTFADWTK